MQRRLRSWHMCRKNKRSLTHPPVARPPARQGSEGGLTAWRRAFPRPTGGVHKGPLVQDTCNPDAFARCADCVAPIGGFTHALIGRVSIGVSVSWPGFHADGNPVLRRCVFRERLDGFPRRIRRFAPERSGVALASPHSFATIPSPSASSGGLEACECIARIG